MKNRIETANNTVKKIFHSKIACEKEKHLLNLLQGSGLCPEMYTYSDNATETEYICGCTLSQLIDRNENGLEFVFEKLIDWVKKFNTITKNIVLDDINLKNFLFCNGKIYGIDFEKWHYGNSAENYTSVLSTVKTAFFKDEAVKEKLCMHIGEYIGCVNSTELKEKTDKIHLRRRVMKKIRNADCVILAGGKSSRMGSPKGLLEYAGHTFIDHIIFNTSVFDCQYISANNRLYNNFSCEIIKDKHMNIGPVGAVHAALTECQKEYVFFIPCDMPFVTEESILLLFDKMESGADAVVFTADDRVFPTVAIYRKTALPAVENQIENNNYKMMELLNSIHTQYVTAPFPQQFKNINTPQDYETIK